jgi:hypothetical protein
MTFEIRARLHVLFEFLPLNGSASKVLNYTKGPKPAKTDDKEEDGHHSHFIL